MQLEQTGVLLLDVIPQLVDAIRRQSFEGVRVALAAGTDPNAYVERTSMLGWLFGSPARLTEMDGEQWLEILRALLEAGADPNQSIDEYPDKPAYLLHDLAQHALLPAMRLMLEFGANPNLLDDDGDTALDLACTDANFVKSCKLPVEYVGRELPEYPLPSDEVFDRQGLAFHLWLMSRHQRGGELLRKAGALHARELPMVTADSRAL